jgi:hypothetical protein
MKKILPLLTFILILLSCSKKQTLSPSTTDPGFITICEGNFTYGNASMTFFDLKKNTSFQNIFQSVNHFKLGDVAQWITKFRSYYFISINNSGKILVINAQSLKFINQITNLTSPRQILVINDSLAVVSDLYAKYLTFFSPENFQILFKLPLHHSSEAMAFDNGFLFVTSWSFDNKIFKINPFDRKVIDSTIVTYQPNSIVIDKFHHLWVLSDGGLWNGAPVHTLPAITELTENLDTIKVFKFNNIDFSPSSLCINSSKDTLFFLNSSWSNTTDPHFGVFKMPVTALSLPQKPFIPQKNATFYRLNYIPQTQMIAVADAKDFQQPGQMLIFYTNGKLFLKFNTGIIPAMNVYKF